MGDRVNFLVPYEELRALRDGFERAKVLERGREELRAFIEALGPNGETGIGLMLQRILDKMRELERKHGS